MTGKKITFKFSTYIFEYRPLLPPPPPTSTLVLCPTRVCLPVRGWGLGTRLHPPRVHSRDKCSQALKASSYVTTMWLKQPTCFYRVKARRRADLTIGGLKVWICCGFTRKASPSREEPDTSLSIMNSKALLHLLHAHAHVLLA